jgi:tRNA(fMet)-specific endonuclease VapC
MKWMLDTDTCIALIKRKPENALKKLRGKSIGQVGVSAITLSELTFGIEKSSRREQAHEALSEFVIALEVAPFEGDAAAVYGRVHASLEVKGQPIGPLDTLIGSHALSLDVTLVTHNTREFSRIDGLRLEDWIAG